MSSLAIQIVDLGFGDAGKGTLVDYLARRHAANLVVRFNGGPQAGHNVVMPDGRHHTFSQFGSASFIPAVRTLLSQFMAIEPYAMLNEARHLVSLGVDDAMDRTWIDARCLVITPPQQIANRVRERARGANAHGTCGVGFGECIADSIDRPELSLFAGDLRNPAIVREKLRAILEQKRQDLEPLGHSASVDDLKVLDDDSWIDVAVETAASVHDRAHIIQPATAIELLAGSTVCLFEGAQGVLLDERHGFHPHTTWSKTTFDNADALLDEAKFSCIRQRIGVMRAYMTRHGTGPFPSHRESLDRILPEPHNSDRGRQGAFRRGLLDWSMLRYALKACGGVDGLAVTHLDRLQLLPPIALDASLEVTMPTLPDEFLATIEDRLQCRIAHISAGPTFTDKDSREIG